MIAVILGFVACAPEQPPAVEAPAPAAPAPAAPTSEVSAWLGAPAAAEPVDCARWRDTVAIPGGPFVMGDDAGDLDERPAHVVWVTGFCLDRRERRMGEVREWLGSDGARSLRQAGVEPTSAPRFSWEEAAIFCEARGGRLPSEAEWEKAARGGCELGRDATRCDEGDARRYPWGDEAPTCDRASFRGRDLAAGDLSLCPDDETAPEPAAGASPYGALGMAGGRMEWVADWYSPWVYGGQRRDPGGPASGATHVLRGGAWNTWPTNLRVSARMSGVLPGSFTGVRCAFGGAAQRIEERPASPPGQEICGEVRRGPGARAEGGELVVTAFGEADLVDGGLPRPGASPAAELGLGPMGETARYCLAVEPGRYRIMAALSDPAGASDGADPIASLGGVGEVGPVMGGQTADITLGPPPPMGAP